MVAIATVLMAASMWAYKQHVKDARIQQSKLLLANIRVGLSAYRYRYGTYPSLSDLANNRDPHNGQAIVTGLPAAASISEPITGLSIVTQPFNPNGGWNYDSTNGTVSVNLATPSGIPSDRLPYGEYPSTW